MTSPVHHRWLAKTWTAHPRPARQLAPLNSLGSHGTHGGPATGPTWPLQLMIVTVHTYIR